MAKSKGPNSTRPRKNPRNNLRSRRQQERRQREKALKKLLDEQKVNDGSFQDCVQKKTRVDFIPTVCGKVKNLHEGCTDSYHSLQECSVMVSNKDSLSTRNRKIQNPEEKSNLPNYLPLTTVVNSVPVVRPSIPEPSKQNQKKLLTHATCRKKSSGIANRCRPRSSSNRRAKAQRLRRLKEKGTLMLRSQQDIEKGFEDSSQVEISIDSRPSRNMEILNSVGENSKYPDTLQKNSIIDSMPVIKTEILDPSEINNALNFQNYSQSATTMGSMPTIKTEILDPPETNEKIPLSNKKVDQTQISNVLYETSRTERLFLNISGNKTSPSFKRNNLQTYPKNHLVSGSEYPFVPDFTGNFKASASPQMKQQFGLKHTDHSNKIAKQKRFVCECFKIKLDYANQLCICKPSNHSLIKNMKPDEEVMKRVCFENPDFGKITSNMRTKLS